MDDHDKELKTAVETHSQTARQVAEKIKVQLADAEAVARRVKSLMEGAASEGKDSKASTTAQCDHLKEVK